jgi:uncharacterized protein (DUF697 family)
MLIKLGQFLVVLSAMVGISIVVGIFGVLFGGFNAQDVLATCIEVSPALAGAYTALAIACLAIVE